MIKNILKSYLKKLFQKYRILEKWYGIRPETKEFYGQFGEDASLQTFFSNLEWNNGNKSKELKTGFYIDIGCYSPIRISNSYWFHKRGWMGINVDISEATITSFQLARPKDINIVAAITDQKIISTMDYYEFGSSSVYNTLSKDSAIETEQKINITPKIKKVKCMTLSNLLDLYLPVNQEISFLSIDAESHDFNILKSNDWNKYKPKAVIVEIHESVFKNLIDNQIIKFLESHGYEVYSWLNPSVILRLK